MCTTVLQYLGHPHRARRYLIVRHNGTLLLHPSVASAKLDGFTLGNSEGGHLHTGDLQHTIVHKTGNKKMDWLPFAISFSTITWGYLSSGSLPAFFLACLLYPKASTRKTYSNNFSSQTSTRVPLPTHTQFALAVIKIILFL